MRKFCVDVFLACGFGALLCVNCVLGSCANRRCENFVLMSSWRSGFGVAVPLGDAKILRGCLPHMRAWRLAVCKLCSG